MPKKNENESYHAKRDGSNEEQSQKEANKKVAKMATKAAADYFTGGKGGAAVDKLANTKLGDKALETMGNRFGKSNPLLAKAAKKLNDSGALDKADQALSMGSNLEGGNGSNIPGKIGDSTSTNLSNENTSPSSGGGKNLGSNLLNSFKNSRNNNETEEPEEQELESDSKFELFGGISSIKDFILQHPNISITLGSIIAIAFFLIFATVTVTMSSAEDGSGNSREEENQQIACATDSKILSIAEAEVGNNEANGTHAKYLSFLGFSPGTAWCAAFVSWCANEAGIEESVIPHTASVSTFLAYFQKAGVFHSISSNYKPVAGNLIIWKAYGRSHIGIVKEFDNSTGILKTVEGNSSDAVRINTYQYSSLESQGVVGFATPEYGEGNCTTCQNISSTAKSSVDLLTAVGTKANTMTYMGWFKITSTSSSQYKLRTDAGEKYDSEGYAIICNRYVIATTQTYGKIGDYLDFYLANGQIISTVIGDAKSTGDKNYNKYGHMYGNSINPIEFVVDGSKWYDKSMKVGNHPNPGTSSCHPEWDSYVVKVVNYGNYWG